MQVDLHGPAGLIEALYEGPQTPGFTYLVCHPHPLHGGTMHNHATYRLAKAVLARSGAVLRINFRGVGRSRGVHSGGVGETDDARVGLAWLAARHPTLPRYAAGFSFGAMVALEVGCADPAVRGVLAVGVAPRAFPADFVLSCPKPVATIQAAEDEFATPTEVERFLFLPDVPRRLAVVASASHLFVEDLDTLQREAEAGISWLLETA
jgi:alpha/beta superfamily hydrolase